MGQAPGNRTAQADSVLVDGIRRGNLRDFSLLVERYKDRAYSLAARILSDPLSAEEAVQDAFVRAYRGIPSFRGDAAFSTWFYRIVYNCCLTRVRRLGPERISLEEAAGEVPVSDELAADEELDLRELTSLVERVLKELPPHWRAVITLYYIDELTYEQIAEVQGIPIGTVKTHLFRARKRMRKLMQDRYNVTEERI